MVAGDSEEERDGFAEGFAGAEAEGEMGELILCGCGRGRGGGGVEVGFGGADVFEECAGDFGEVDGADETGAAGADGFDRVELFGHVGSEHPGGELVEGDVVLVGDFLEREGRGGEVGEKGSDFGLRIWDFGVGRGSGLGAEMQFGRVGRVGGWEMGWKGGHSGMLA